jgi:iron(III) transport system permease protein
VQSSVAETASPKFGAAFDAKWVVIGISLVVVAILALVPFCFMIWQSFHTPETASSPSVFTLGNYVTAYTNPETVAIFWNSVQFALGTSLLAFVIGTALAWMNERTNTPLRRLFFALSIVPLIIPGILFTISWIMLASPKIGLLNTWAMAIFGLDSPPFNIYSMWGMIWVDALHCSPMAFLLMSSAFKAMDPSLEESAVMSGSSIMNTLRRITLKLAYPAIMATVLTLFVNTIASFEVPALLGLPAGIQVFTSAIYQSIHQYPSQIGLAGGLFGDFAHCSPPVAFTSSLRISSSGSKYCHGHGQRLSALAPSIWASGAFSRWASSLCISCSSWCLPFFSAAVVLAAKVLCTTFHGEALSKHHAWTATVMCLLLPIHPQRRR